MPHQQNPAPTADRRRRSFWIDPRFAIGLLFVAVSVAGVVALVAAVDSSITVLAARSSLTPGERVLAADLIATEVRVGRADELYLTSVDIPAEGLVVTRPISAGELVPASAVGTTEGLQQTSVVLPIGTGLPVSVVAGARIEVWSARARAAGDFEEPVVIVPTALVVRLIEQEGLIASDRGASVEVLVPHSAIARVLEALANDAAVSIVPVDLPLRG